MGGALDGFCPDDGGRFVHGHRDSFAVICRQTDEAFRLLEHLLPNPDELYRTATIYKPGTRTHGGSLLLDGTACFLKRYNNRGVWYRVRHAFIPSRAVRTWRLAWSMLDAGVPVPEPLVCLEERRARLLHRSYVLMRFASGCMKMRELWPGLDQFDRERLILQLAAVFARMHRAGVLHGDLKWDNILVAPGNPEKIMLVDLDGGRFIEQADRRLAEKDVQRFVRDLEQRGGAGMISVFMEAWRREMRI